MSEHYDYAWNLFLGLSNVTVATFEAIREAWLDDGTSFLVKHKEVFCNSICNEL